MEALFMVAFVTGMFVWVDAAVNAVKLVVKFFRNKQGANDNGKEE